MVRVRKDPSTNLFQLCLHKVERVYFMVNASNKLLLSMQHQSKLVEIVKEIVVIETIRQKQKPKLPNNLLCVCV